MNVLSNLADQISIVRANRWKLSQVKPQLAAACFQIIEYVRSKGHCLVVVQGYRPPEIQDWLYERGRSRPGDIIVNDRANECKYTTGEAVAFGFFNAGSTPEPFHLINEAANKLGLICSDGCDVNAPKGQHVEMPSANYVMPTVELVPRFRALKIIAAAAVLLALIVILIGLFK